MVNLSISGDSIVFEFINSNYYLQNGKIATPINSLALITDESNIATFKKASSNDIFVAATYDELEKTKAELIEWFKDNAVGATGGGGDLDDYYTKEQTDALLSGKTDVSAFTAYSASVQTALQGKASQSDLNTVSGAVDTKASNTDLQALESVVGGKLNTSDFNSYSANVDTAIASKASNTDLQTVSGAVDTKLSTSDFNTYSGAIDTALQGKTDVSAFTAYTSATETVLGNKADVSSLTAYFDGVEYNSVNKTIEFYNDNVLKDSIDATDFIKDGMVDNVSISGGNLVITFNTDAGKEDIEIPLIDIFNPNNYYDKTATDGLLDAKVDVTAYTAYTSSTETALNGKASQTDLETVSGDVATKLATSDFNTYSGNVNTAITSIQGDITNVQTALNGKVDVSAYTAYTSATETTINGKASQTDLNALSGNVDTLSGQVADKADTTAMTTALADKVDVSAYTAYTSATDTVLSGKASQTDLNTVSGNVATVSAATASNTTALGGYKLWKGTQVQYDAIVTKDEDTIYFIVNNS